MMEASACLLQGNLDIELGVEQLLRAHAKLQFKPSCTCGPHTYPARSSKTHQFVEGSTYHQHGLIPLPCTEKICACHFMFEIPSLFPASHPIVGSSESGPPGGELFSESPRGARASARSHAPRYARLSPEPGGSAGGQRFPRGGDASGFSDFFGKTCRKKVLFSKSCKMLSKACVQLETQLRRARLPGVQVDSTSFLLPKKHVQSIVCADLRRFL